MKIFRRKLLKSFFVLALAGFAGLNVSAFMHARKMIRYGGDEAKTQRPGSLKGLAKAKVLFTGVSVPRPLDFTDPAAEGMAFEPVELQAKDGSALHAWYVPHPNPRATALLVHGYAACKSSMVGEGKVLHAQGCALLLIDQRGSGESCEASCSIGYWEGRDVKAGLDWLQDRAPDLPRLAYGQSMGSASILSAIHLFGAEPDAIALESPFPEFHGTVRNRFRLMKLPDYCTAELLCFWGGVQVGMNAFTYNPVDYAASVKVPALVMIGAKDLYVYPQQAERVHLAMDNSRFEVFHQSGHEAYSDKEPEKHARVVGDWLEGVLSGR